MSIYKRKDIWYIDYRAGGRRYKEAIGPSKRFAQAVLAKRKTEIAENRFLDVAKARETSFEQLSDAYMDWAWVNKQSADRNKRSIQTLARWFGGRKSPPSRHWQSRSTNDNGTRKSVAPPSTANCPV